MCLKGHFMAQAISRRHHCHWARFFSEHFGFPLLVSLYQCFVVIHSSIVTLYYLNNRQLFQVRQFKGGGEVIVVLTHKVDFLSAQERWLITQRWSMAVKLKYTTGNRKMEDRLFRGEIVARICGSLKLYENERGTNISVEYKCNLFNVICRIRSGQRKVCINWYKFILFIFGNIRAHVLLYPLHAVKLNTLNIFAHFFTCFRNSCNKQQTFLYKSLTSCSL